MTDDRGIVVAGTDEASLGRPLPRLANDEVDRWKSRSITFAGGGRAGAVHIRFSQGRLRAAYREVATRGMVIALAGMIGSALVALFLGRVLVARLERLRSCAREIAGGNLALRCDVAGSDEVAHLSEAFNSMTASVQALIAAGEEREQRLRESEEKYRGLYREAVLGIFHSTLDGRFVDVNPALARMLGYDSPEEVLAAVTNIAEQVYADPPVRDSVAQQALAAGGVLTRQNRYRRRDGSLWWGLLHLRIIREAHGQPGHYEGFIEDITERKQVEERLAQLHLHHELILRSAAEGILGLDMRGDHTFVNPAAAKMLGYDVEELLGRPSHGIWHHTRPDGSPYPREECRIYAAYRDGMVHHETTEVFWRKDGTSFPVEYTSTPIREQGRLVGAVVTFEDSTERLRSAEEKDRLESQLRQGQKVEAIGRLAGGVAHDFNNLTAIVLGYGEMLLGQLPPEDPGRKWVEQIVAAGRRSAALTRQLLAFSRKQTLQPEVLDLNELLRNLEKMLGRLIGEDIELDVRLIAEPVRVKADPGQIEQVVTNLVVNARDAMPLGGRLTVETAIVELDDMFALRHEGVVPGKYVMLALADNGCGMDQATMARLFEPFFTTKPQGKGTGLGLATAYGIVKQSGGYIWAASESGKGTTFRIYLPWTDAAAVGKAGGAEREPQQGSGESILLVEDETALRELCETVLTRLGYRVSAAGNGLEALLLVQEQGLSPDLVVTDVIMPGMSGAEMAELLRRGRPGLGVLYMSGYPDDTIAPHGVLAPGTPFIQKPFTERALAVKVREALAGKAAAAEPAGVSTPGGSGRRILMIDDDEQYRDLVRLFCARKGLACVGVDSAAAALEALAQQPFDVLLVDLNIPGTSGECVLREIRAAGNDAPAIVLTGDMAAADMGVLRPLGVVRALEKSSRAAPLLQAIEEA